MTFSPVGMLVVRRWRLAVVICGLATMCVSCGGSLKVAGTVDVPAQGNPDAAQTVYIYPAGAAPTDGLQVPVTGGTNAWVYVQDKSMSGSGTINLEEDKYLIQARRLEQRSMCVCAESGDTVYVECYRYTGIVECDGLGNCRYVELDRPVDAKKGIPLKYNDTVDCPSCPKCGNTYDTIPDPPQGN